MIGINDDFGENFNINPIIIIKLKEIVKEIPNGFPCLDILIQTRGMLLEFRKAKNTRLAARVF